MEALMGGWLASWMEALMDGWLAGWMAGWMEALRAGCLAGWVDCGCVGVCNVYVCVEDGQMCERIYVSMRNSYH